MMKKIHNCSRREMIVGTAAGATCLVLPWPAGGVVDDEKSRPLRFGLIADIHQDVMHDGEKRLKAFIDAMNKAKVNFIMQLGDFCIPTPQNKPFLAIWNRFDGSRYHVLGNHDMDGDDINRPDEVYAYTREETAKYWGMIGRYYSFDQEGVHFVVLDGNDQGPGQDGYFHYIAEDQAKWLAKDLADTNLPTLVFIHQSLERGNGGVENQADIRALMEQANEQAGTTKVVACFSGHHHRDYCREINGIQYPQINSASYHWLGGNYIRARYSEEIENKYPYIKYTLPYKDPIWAIVTINRKEGIMTIEGRKSEFVGPTPWDLGVDRADVEAETITAAVTGHKLPFAK